MSNELPRKNSGIEELTSLIPGYGNYRNLESRRDDDRNTRKYVAARLVDCKRTLDNIARAAIERGDFDRPSQLEKILSRIDLAQGRVASAVEGYAGWFSERKVDVELLQRVGELDANLVSLVHKIENQLQSCLVEKISVEGNELTELLDTLHARIDRRRELLQGEVG